MTYAIRKNVMIFSPEHKILLDLLLYLNGIDNINVHINSNTFFLHLQDSIYYNYLTFKKLSFRDKNVKVYLKI